MKALRVDENEEDYVIKKLNKSRILLFVIALLMFLQIAALASPV